MRFILLAMALIFISTPLFAQGAGSDLQLEIDGVRYNQTTSELPRLEILTIAKSDFLKGAKRKRIQIIRAVDNLGNDLMLREFNKANEDFSAIDKKDDTSASLLIELKSPPSEATHIRRIDATLELYIPDFDAKAKIVFPNFSGKLARGVYFEPNIFAAQLAESSAPKKFEASLRVTYNLSAAGSGQSGDIINVEIEDKSKKVLDVLLIDKKGNDILPDTGGWSFDKTNLSYKFYANPTQIADLVIYSRTYNAIQILPLEYQNIPLPQR